MANAVIDIIDVTRWLQEIAPSANLSLDSRRITRGDIFLACRGESGDGRQHIQQAIESGAKAIVFEISDDFQWNIEWTIAHFGVLELAKMAGRIAHEWYRKPDTDMFSVAVTGTNGKTSCTQWLGQALSREGLPTAVIGTLGIAQCRNGEIDRFEETGLTTPDAVQLFKHLAQQKQRGSKALAIEASSIGLAQGRLDELHIDVAVFTNFTRDHLDYHGSMAAYEAAKAALFDWPSLKHAIINLDDPMGARLLAKLRRNHSDVTVIGYTVEGAQHDSLPVLSASDIRVSQQGTNFQLSSPFGSSAVRTQLIGLFNVSNVLAIAGVLLARGSSWNNVVRQIESLTAVPGRMEQLGGQEGPLAVIDYAHTPDALEKTLQTLRQVADARHGRVWCVFGCGGDRDPGKRPQMTEAALAADHLVITSDNPRSENPADIIQQMIHGCGSLPSEKIQVIEDRAQAILSAIRYAGKNDVVLVAGKGHEDYQEIKGKKLAFRDADHAALALATRATRFGGH